MPLSLPQLTLDLFDDGNIELADFLPGPNQFVLDALHAWLDGRGPWYVLLAGRSGSGKTHLVQGAVRAIGRAHRRTMYLPLEQVREFGVAILEELEAIDFLAIDDIDTIAGDPVWERAVFDLFNRTLAANGRLLVSSAVGPRGFEFALPDLGSRLTSGLTCQLQELDDEDKQALLKQRAARRGLTMPDNVARYLISRLSRDMHELNSIFERIDSASMSAGRELTIPFVREVLGID